jgi:predicted transcriptional regulator
MLVSETMIRLMRALLISDEPISLRELTKRADVTLSRASKEIDRLYRAGYVRKRPQVAVQRRRDLLLAFSYCWSIKAVPFEAFDALERPDHLSKVITKIAKKEGLAYAFTLLVGTEVLSPYVVPSTVHLYIDGAQVEKWRKALSENGIYPTESRTIGKVNLLIYDGSVLQGAIERKGVRVVSPYQLFADLHGMGGIMRDAADKLAERMGWGE